MRIEWDDESEDNSNDKLLSTKWNKQVERRLEIVYCETYITLKNRWKTKRFSLSYWIKFEFFDDPYHTLIVNDATRLCTTTQSIIYITCFVAISCLILQNYCVFIIFFNKIVYGRQNYHICLEMNELPSCLMWPKMASRKTTLSTSAPSIWKWLHKRRTT